MRFLFANWRGVDEVAEGVMSHFDLSKKVRPCPVP